MNYEQGFLDALMFVEYYLKKYNLMDEKIGSILEGLKEAVVEKRIDRLKMELGLL